MQKLREAFPNARVRGTLHHEAHGLYAYAASGFGDAAVLIVDSLGWTRRHSQPPLSSRWPARGQAWYFRGHRWGLSWGWRC
jgi:predicted NodU family carbamoyl transferase